MIGKLAVAIVAAGAVAVFTAEALANTAAPATGVERPGISIELGERDFRGYCAACHGVSGVGDGTIAEYLTLSVPDLTRLAKRSGGLFPRQRVIDVIDGRAEVKVHGDRDMPVWGEWFDKEAIDPGTDAATRELIVNDRIDSLVTFIETLQTK